VAGWRPQGREGSSPFFRTNSHILGWYMDADFGLLWVPAGFLFILLTIMALFLTV